MKKENNTIQYQEYVDAALRGVVRKVLTQVEAAGLQEPHHFFISFSTQYPGVEISQALKQRYPEEMTIVIQYQFWDLRVHADSFQVALSFNNIPEKLVIPFAALRGFADPSMKFGLQFTADHVPAVDALDANAEVPMPSPERKPIAEDGAKIITLDAFRKK